MKAFTIADCFKYPEVLKPMPRPEWFEVFNLNLMGREQERVLELPKDFRLYATIDSTQYKLQGVHGKGITLEKSGGRWGVLCSDVEDDDRIVQISLAWPFQGEAKVAIGRTRDLDDYVPASDRLITFWPDWFLDLLSDPRNSIR